jgi:hypothetical protein
MREMAHIPEDGNLSQPPGVPVVNHGRCGPIRALAGHAGVEIARRKPRRTPGVGRGPSGAALTRPQGRHGRATCHAARQRSRLPHREIRSTAT